MVVEREYRLITVSNGFILRVSCSDEMDRAVDTEVYSSEALQEGEISTVSALAGCLRSIIDHSGVNETQEDMEVDVLIRKKYTGENIIDFSG